MKSLRSHSQRGAADNSFVNYLVLVGLAVGGYFLYAEGYPRWLLEPQTQTEIMSIIRINASQREERMKAKPNILRDEVIQVIQDKWGKRLSDTPKVKVEQIGDWDFRALVIYEYQIKHPFMEPKFIEKKLKLESTYDDM